MRRGIAYVQASLATVLLVGAAQVQSEPLTLVDDTECPGQLAFFAQQKVPARLVLLGDETREALTLKFGPPARIAKIVTTTWEIRATLPSGNEYSAGGCRRFTYIASDIAPEANDKISLIGEAGETGLWVNGVVNGVQWNHRIVAPTADDPIDLGANLTPSALPNGNEVVLFPSARPPTLLTLPTSTGTSWTNQTDSLVLALRPSRTVSITRALIAKRPDTLVKAQNDFDFAAATWKRERVGYELDAGGPVIDLSNTPEAILQNKKPGFFVKDCGDLDALDATFRKHLLARKPSLGQSPTIVIYYVKAPYVADGRLNGSQCDFVNTGRTVIIVALDAPPETLAHELGHGLSLPHFEDDPRNIMKGGGVPNRRYLTEGQTFNISYNSTSALNYLYKFTPLQVWRACETDPDSPDYNAQSLACPRIDLRIWADGDTPPTANVD